MKTKLLYVVVSTDRDIYLEQAYISMYSAKHYMPECNITLLIDKVTHGSLTGIRKREVSLADEIVVVDLDQSFSAQKRSRILKTGARNYISGDFLFIDCDTIVVKNLADVDSFDFAIGACRDTHSCFLYNPYREMCIGDVRKLGRDISNERTYFNSGVMYVKDVPETYAFYNEWRKNYEMGYSKGVTMDQPSLALTNINMGYFITEIPDIWNCELKHGIRYLRDARIVHYLCTNVSANNDKQFFLLNEKAVMLDVKKTGEIPERVKAVITDPFCGIAELTHCFAGTDVFFFQTNAYAFLNKRFKKSGKNSLFENIIKLGGRIKGLLK